LNLIQKECKDLIENEYFKKKFEIFNDNVEHLLELNQSIDNDNDNNGERRKEIMLEEALFFEKFISPVVFGELFAIRASEAFIVSIYALCLSEVIGPKEALIRIVNWGGDADTVRLLMMIDEFYFI
jgi:ADP-ribosylglycohydrolase